MRAGYNPTRRSRNIGTAKQGHGQNNRQRIPRSRHLVSHLDLIGDHRVEVRQVQGKDIRFIVETCRRGAFHPCSVEDVARLLGCVSLSDWAGLDTIVFRQPTRRQHMLNPLWGRLHYSGAIVTARGRDVAKGAMIVLDAVYEDFRLDWLASLNPDASAELERLRGDGHRIERVGNRYSIGVSVGSARNTQLYRTLLHEIGHWFDWLEKVEAPCQRGEPFEPLCDRYFARPSSEREAFAHRYADAAREDLVRRGVIPFEPLSGPNRP